MKKFLLIILASCAAIVGCQKGKPSLSLPPVINVKVNGTATVQMQVLNDFNNEVDSMDEKKWEIIASGEEKCFTLSSMFLVRGLKAGTGILTYKYKPLDISASTTVVVTE